MTIKYYSRGEHPSGFVGFQVISTDGRQRDFSTEHIPSRSSDAYRLQQLLAERQALDWEIERLEAHYQQFVTTDDPDTPPAHALGVHGLTADFYQDGKNVWQGCFTVTYRESDTSPALRRFSFTRRLYSAAWRAAVGFWGRQHRVRKADIQRILNSPPPAERFKELRHYLNDEEKLDIPTSALSSIFREQREALAQRARAQTVRAIVPETLPEETLQSSLAQEIAQWMQQGQLEPG